jgi:hypothetical protein
MNLDIFKYMAEMGFHLKVGLHFQSLQAQVWIRKKSVQEQKER